MAQQIEVDPSAITGTFEEDGTREVAPDLAQKRLGMVNVAFVGEPQAGDGAWVLVDAGLPVTAGMIERAAKERFGEAGRPAAIILTHAHVDHVGALKALAEHWRVAVYAHPVEMPYLTGQESYPPPDTHAEGGIMPQVARLFPRSPIDVSAFALPLPDDGSVPHMPGWQWLHTPGHTDGHVSFWREGDRTLLSGDAFITTAQESAYAIAVQEPELHGPPRYFTPDWVAARKSVETLSALQPEVVVTGHGQPMRGPAMREALAKLAREFDHVAVPEHLRRA